MQYDLIIIGGGLVGAGLATALHKAPFKIALVDARLPDGKDQRLFALNNSSCEFLKNIGLWPKLADSATPIEEVQVSHQGHFGSVRLHCEDVNLATLGYVIPAYLIETALNEALAQIENITLYRPAKLKSLTRSDGNAYITIESEKGEQTLHSAIIIGADGTDSTVRAQLDIPIDAFDYEQTAIVTRTTLKRAHHHIAYERFIKGGAIAMLPLAHNECATIWTIDHARAQDLLALSDEKFLQNLQQEFGFKLGRFEKISKRFSYPLRMVRAKKTVAENVFLLGNSAHTLHPIAAQGFNLALYEVAVLVENIMEKAALSRPLSIHDLEKMSAQIENQKAASIGLSHRLTQLFGSQSVLLGALLSLSMVGFNLLPPIKKRFIKTMLGKTGRVPRLLMNPGIATKL